MRPRLLLLALALAIGPAAAEVAAPEPSVRMTMLQYQGDRPHNEPWIMIATDGHGNARDGFAAGHGGMLFMTRDNVGYVVVGRGDRVGLQADMFSVLATRGSAGRDNRTRIERLSRQHLAIVPAGTERVAGIEGRVYRLTLTGGDQPPHSFEMVISTDPRLAAAGREILRFYDQLRAPVTAVTGSEPQPYAAIRGLLASGTPLRVGPHYRLREMEVRAVPASLFALPGPVLSRELLLADLEGSGMFADAGDMPEPVVNELADNMASEADLNDIMMDADAAVNAAAAQAVSAAAAAAAAAAADAANATMAPYSENDADAANAANPD